MMVCSYKHLYIVLGLIEKFLLIHESYTRCLEPRAVITRHWLDCFTHSRYNFDGDDKVAIVLPNSFTEHVQPSHRKYFFCRSLNILFPNLSAFVVFIDI